MSNTEFLFCMSLMQWYILFIWKKAPYLSGFWKCMKRNDGVQMKRFSTGSQISHSVGFQLITCSDTLQQKPYTYAVWIRKKCGASCVQALNLRVSKFHHTPHTFHRSKDSVSRFMCEGESLHRAYESDLAFFRRKHLFDNHEYKWCLLIINGYYLNLIWMSL